MRASASAALLSAALCALVLTGCRPDAGSSQAGNARTDGTGDLIGQVLFMATGAFDVQSTQKARVPGGLRRAVWEDRVPLDARRVVIQYDSDARPMTWMLELTQPGFTARDVAGADARAVRTAQGEGLRPGAASRLRDTLVLTRTDGLKILTRSYATQVEPELLGAFQPAR
ncbi:hypothetical protein [Deinococcus sp.]|uniref:hypothetical protein n=1 Tax=Deinococcus sp. TaxID=47478 RepID=UPI00391976ED